jgi:hypothetical protein
MSNLGHWQHLYAEGKPVCYGNEITYRIGAEFLADCATIEDWGCGGQFFREIMRGRNPACKVIGIDGSEGCCDIVAELAEYRPATILDGLFLRHVLEHNRNWREILANALASFRRKFFLALFTPPSVAETNLYEFRFPSGATCPVLSLPFVELFEIVRAAGCNVTSETMISPGLEFGVETVLRIEKPQ